MRPQELSASRGLTLVLGGGGASAVAWEIGVACGLAEHGLDVRRAVRMIGTSAGAVVACRLSAGTTSADLLAWARTPRVEAPVEVDFPALMQRLTDIGARATSPTHARQQIGALAIAARTGPPQGRRFEIAALIGEGTPPKATWPVDTDLVVTAVDAHTGEFVAFTRNSRVELLDAVGASCAVPGVWPPVLIGGRTFVDGAVRSAVNASLAAGDATVLVLAPQPGPGIDREIGRLGPETHAEVVVADPDSVLAFGANPLDTATGPACVEAGLRQGRAAGDVAERLQALVSNVGVR